VLHEEQRAPILMLLWGVQIAAALATAVGVWIGSRWTVATLLTAGASLVISTLVESLALGMQPLLAASAEILIVVLATGGLAVMLRSRPGGDGSERHTARPQPQPPRP
jgi:hypothetical protein